MREEAMFRLSRKSCLLIAAVGVYFLFRYMDSLWSLSIDVAHHYLLAFRLSEQWDLDPTTSDMGVMGFYPKGAHVMAAVVGEFLNSTLAGMQAVSILAVVLLWVGVLFVLTQLPGRHSLVVPIVLALLLLVNRTFQGVEVHGAEIIGNYFYSQLVAQALAFVVIGFAIRSELSGSRIGGYWILWVGCVLIAFVHLLPALELLGILCGLMFLELLNRRRFDFRVLALYAVIALAAVLSVYFHPSFAAMRKIAENNGSLDLRFLSYPLGIMLLCLGVFLSSTFCCLWSIRKGAGESGQVIKYLGVYGVVISALCMLQFAALQFGYGSDYAIKKYGFGLITQAFLLLSIALSRVISRPLSLCFERFSSPRPDGFVLAGLHAAVFFALVLAALPKYKGFDVSDFVRLERQVVQLRESVLPVLPAGKSNAVVDIAQAPATLDYMFSISMGNTPLLQAVKDVLQGPAIDDLNKYEYVIESAADGRYRNYGCPSLTTGPLAVRSASCLLAVDAIATRCLGTHDLQNSQSERVLAAGFGVKEAAGRWTNGKHAQLQCEVAGQMPRLMRLKVSPFVYGQLLRQRVRIRINGSEIGNFELSGGQTREMSIPLPPIDAAQALKIDFDMPDAVSPRDMGVSEDSRVLGLFFNTIEFQ